MNEWNYIILVPFSALFFAIGGTGYKWVRRYILPCLIALIMWLNHIPIWSLILVNCLFSVLFHLSYGDSTPNLLKTLLFVAYFLPVLFIGFTWWIILGISLTIFVFFLSNFKLTEKVFTWKIWELLAGALIGLSIAQVITK